MSRWLAAVAIGGVACSSRPTPPPPRPSPPPDAALAPAPPGSRGEACTPDDTDLAGTCVPGLVCAPVPGGYCTSTCGPTGTACAADSVCADTLRAGNLCVAACAADGGCARAGLTCDPAWRACVPAGMLAPRAPTCPAIAAPTRAAFARSERISSSGGPGVYDVEPAAAVLPDGSLVALYVAGARLGAPNRLAVARIGADGTRTFDAAFATDRDNHFDPWLAIDRAGAVHAVWLGFDGGRAPERNMTVGHAVSRDGGATWSKPGAALDANADCPRATPGCVDKPMIAIGPDADGTGEAIYVAYASTVTEAMRLVVSRDGGATWSRSVRAHAGSYGDLEVDDAGTVHVVAVEVGSRDLTSTANRVTYTATTDGGTTFAKPVAVSATDEAIPFFFSNPDLAVDVAAHRIHVAYPTGTPDGAWDVMLATSRDAGKTWTRIKVNDDARCATHMAPEVIVDAQTGKLFVSWYDSRGGGRLAYAACDPGGAWCARSESVSDQPFAAFGFVRHGAAWLGEYHGLVLDPKRRILHAVWTQPVLQAERAIARIFHGQAKLATPSPAP